MTFARQNVLVMFMSIQAQHPAFTPARDAHRARLAEHMAALKELSDIAVELAKALGRQAIVAAQAGGEVAEAAEKTFSRATRSVRLTAALDVRLSKSLLAMDEADEGGEGQSREEPYELAGAAQRLREVLAPWIVPEPAAPGEDEAGAETGEGRERGDRERLVETEGDGSLGAALRGAASRHTDKTTPETPSPSMGEAQGPGCSLSRSGEDRGWAPEPSGSSSSPTGATPPSQPFPHRGGRALSAGSELDPERKARAP